MNDPETIRQFVDCCALLRRGRQSAASLVLDKLLGRLSVFLEERPDRVTPVLQASVARALDCQQRNDLIALADELEHVVLPSLGATRPS